jgi:hypothetical protein
VSRAPWDLRPDITSYRNVAVWNLRSCFSGASLRFAVQSLNGPSHAEPETILYCIIWDSPNLEGQVPVFISPRNRVAQLNPRELGSLYVASCDSQGYGGGILTLSQPGRPGPRICIYPSGTGWSSQKSKLRYDRRSVYHYVLVPSPRGFKGAPSKRISIRQQEGYIKAKFFMRSRSHVTTDGQSVCQGI